MAGRAQGRTLEWQMRSCQCISRMANIERQMEVALVNPDHRMVYVPVEDSVTHQIVTDSDYVELSVNMGSSVQEMNQSAHGSHENIYSLLVARSYYYEVVKQTKVIPKPSEYIIEFAKEPCMYAVHLKPNFIHYLAERTVIPHDASLHICVHNPMIEPHNTL